MRLRNLKIGDKIKMRGEVVQWGGNRHSMATKGQSPDIALTVLDYIVEKGRVLIKAGFDEHYNTYLSPLDQIEVLTPDEVSGKV